MQIETVVGVLDIKSKQVLVLDIEETPEAIQSKLSREQLKKYIKGEERKPEAAIELTSNQLINMSIL
jgi:hypothetical protein